LCGLSQGCALGYDMAPFQGLVPEKIPGPNGARQPGPGQSPGNAVQPKLQKPRRAEISSAQGNALGPFGPRIQALDERNSATPLKRSRARCKPGYSCQAKKRLHLLAGATMTPPQADSPPPQQDVRGITFPTIRFPRISPSQPESPSTPTRGVSRNDVASDGGASPAVPFPAKNAAAERSVAVANGETSQDTSFSLATIERHNRTRLVLINHRGSHDCRVKRVGADKCHVRAFEDNALDIDSFRDNDGTAVRCRAYLFLDGLERRCRCLSIPRFIDRAVNLPRCSICRVTNAQSHNQPRNCFPHCSHLRETRLSHGFHTHIGP
jgi:hypothetical protein